MTVKKVLLMLQQYPNIPVWLEVTDREPCGECGGSKEKKMYGPLKSIYDVNHASAGESRQQVLVLTGTHD